ncbi:hypothetical protein Tco_0086758 [Tanacetum coccineum]
MEKNVISSCTDSEEMEMKRLQKKARIMKDSCINGLSVLKSKFTIISKKDVPGITASEFEHAFSRIFGEKVDTYTRTVLKTPFEKIFTSVLIQSSSLDGTYSRKDFKAYTGMEPQAFKERILANFDFIQKYMIESILHNKEIEQRMNAKKLQIQECKVQEVKASDASSGDKDSSGIVSDRRNDESLENQSKTPRDKSSRSRNECNDKSTSGDDTNIKPSYDTKPIAEVPYTAKYNVFAVESQHSEQPKNMNDTSLMKKVDSNTTLDSSYICNNEFKDDQNADNHEKLKECKSTLEETNRTLWESNSTRDSCLIALQNKEIKLEKYKTYLNRTTEYDTLERKLKETQTVLAQKENDIKEGLKLKAYEISIVKKEHDELVKQSLLTKSSYEGLVKKKNQVIKDLKLKEKTILTHGLRWKSN